MFESEEEKREMLELLEAWKRDPNAMKDAFIRLKDMVASKEDAILGFKARPGVSYSLRASFDSSGGRSWPLFVMADIIDDDPENRWLSVCFYGDMVTDPDEEGDLVPGGLLGEDGYCFDLNENDEAMIRNLGSRIDEAYAYVKA